MRISDQLSPGWPPAVLAAAVVALAADPAAGRVLELVQVAEGPLLASARSLVMSADGRHLYAGGEGLDVFARNAASGERYGT